MIQPDVELRYGEAPACLYLGKNAVVCMSPAGLDKKRSKRRGGHLANQAVLFLLSTENTQGSSVQVLRSHDTSDNKNIKQIVACQRISRYRNIEARSLYEQLALTLPDPHIPKIAPATAYGYLGYSVWETFQCENRPIARAAVKLERSGVLSIGHLVVLTRAQVSQYAFMKPDIVEAMDQKLSTIGLGFGMVLRKPSFQHKL